MMPLPTMPPRDCDKDVLLAALMTVYPKPFYNPNERLGLTANSRASELRTKHGWDIKAVETKSPSARKGKVHGYQLRTPREDWPEAARTHLVIQSDGQVAIAS